MKMLNANEEVGERRNGKFGGAMKKGGKGEEGCTKEEQDAANKEKIREGLQKRIKILHSAEAISCAFLSHRQPPAVFFDLPESSALRQRFNSAGRSTRAAHRPVAVARIDRATHVVLNREHLEQR